MTPFKPTSDNDLLKAMLFNRSRLAESGCWLWVGSTRKGYGLICRNGKTTSAHRVSYEAYHGPIPKEMVVCHSCDNPGCINPDHLRADTLKANAQDREMRGRRDVRGEQVGTAKLSEEDVRSIRASSETGRHLARKYGVDPSAISFIRRNVTWKHVRADEVTTVR